MQKPIRHYRSLSTEARRGLSVIGLIALAMLTFALLTLQDLLYPESFNETIANLIPPFVILASLLGLILCWRDRPEAAAWVVMGTIMAGMLTLPIVTTNTAFTLVGATIAFSMPVLIAIQIMKPQRLAAVFLLGMTTATAVLLIDTFEPEESIITAYAPEAIIAQIVAITTIAAVLYYTIRQFPRYPFQTKVVLTLAFLGVVPTLFLTVLNARALTDTLTRNAIQVLNRAAAGASESVTRVLTNKLEVLGVESQRPALSEYLWLPQEMRTASRQEALATATLLSLLRKDPDILAYSLLDPSGQVLISTRPAWEGQNWANRPEFSSALQQKASIGNIRPFDKERYALSFAAPVVDLNGNIIGVLVMDYNAKSVQALLERIAGSLGGEMTVLLLDEKFLIVGNSEDPGTLYRLAAMPDDATLQRLQADGQLPRLPRTQLAYEIPGLIAGLGNAGATPTNFATEIHAEVWDKRHHAEQASAIRLVLPQERTMYLVVSQPIAALLAPVTAQARTALLVGITFGVIGILIALTASRTLVRPIRDLTTAAEQVATGNLETEVRIRTGDEIGSLAQTFNSMTVQLRTLIASLEQRVAERTNELNRRAQQIQAAAEVGSAAASLRDPEALLNEAVRQISARFGYYHAGIFLLDERGEFAVLRASNSAGGQRMLARGHRLRLGPTSIVGYVAEKGEPRIALDVGADAVFFDNPDLPGTRSEMALPLRIGERVIGVLDVQSTEAGAFTKDDIATLRILTDQLAIAIENARLIEEGKKALEAERRAYGELARAAWRRQGQIGYLATSRRGPVPLEDAAWSPSLQEAVRLGAPKLDRKNNSLGIPIKVREATIGAIRLQKPDDSPWTEAEMQAAQTLAEQLGVALESARQYQETQVRAERERQINLIAGQVRSAINIENVLQSTIRELGKALGASRAFIQIGAESGAPGKEEE